MGVAGAAVVTAVIAAILTRANGTTALDGSIGCNDRALDAWLAVALVGAVVGCSEPDQVGLR
jgi:hypothetical protein